MEKTIPRAAQIQQQKKRWLIFFYRIFFLFVSIWFTGKLFLDIKLNLEQIISLLFPVKYLELRLSYKVSAKLIILRVAKFVESRVQEDQKYRKCNFEFYVIVL